MSESINLHEKFLEYFHEMEGYALRSERFYAEYKDPAIAAKWMEAAFMAGARTTAQDTLDTLGDYATTVAGINDPKYTFEQAFDAARKNLMTYYTQLFDGGDTQ